MSHPDSPQRLSLLTLYLAALLPGESQSFYWELEGGVIVDDPETGRAYQMGTYRESFGSMERLEVLKAVRAAGCQVKADSEGFTAWRPST